MKKIIWTARYLSAPTVVKYCKRCGEVTTFASSGLFRVNAQQKALDIWLIYKCTCCDTTWNLTVLSRVNPQSLAPELLDGFHGNDGELAMKFATDIALIKQNGAAPGVPVIDIAGEQVEFDEPVCIQLTAEWPAEIKASTAIRSKLGLSANEFARLCDSGRLICVSGHNIRKCKLVGTIEFEIRKPNENRTVQTGRAEEIA